MSQPFKIDDRVYVTGTLVVVAVGLFVALLIWVARFVSWKWNRYITAVALEHRDDGSNESDYEPLQPPPQPISTARRNTNRGGRK